MYLYGKIKAIRSVRDSAVVDLERANGFKENAMSVWYSGKFAPWVLEKTNLIGKWVLILARESSKDGKTYTFGARLPMAYGMLTTPVTIKDDAEDRVGDALEAIEDCIAEEELPEDTMLNLEEPQSIVELTRLLRSSSNPTALQAAETLMSLIEDETNAYIGRIASVDKYNNVTKVSFATPNTTPTEWNSVSFFKNNAQRAAEILRKGDSVVLLLGAKKMYNGKPDFFGLHFHKCE
jgi:hypothetical protein